MCSDLTKAQVLIVHVGVQGEDRLNILQGFFGGGFRSYKVLRSGLWFRRNLGFALGFRV